MGARLRMMSATVNVATFFGSSNGHSGDFISPNVQDEPRPWLARAVLLGARIVTAMVVGSGALLGLFIVGARRRERMQAASKDRTQTRIATAAEANLPLRRDDSEADPKLPCGLVNLSNELSAQTRRESLIRI